MTRLKRPPCSDSPCYQLLSSRLPLAPPLHILARVAFQHVAHCTVAGKRKGLGHEAVRLRSHLPLRGKLGWMTPMTRSRLGRVTERGFWGCRSQAAALFFSARRSAVPKILQFSANSLSLDRRSGCSPSAARAPLPCPSVAMHRTRTPASSSFHRVGISAGRTYSRKRPAFVAVLAAEETAIRTSCS